MAPAELAFEDMPRAAVRFTYFAKTLTLTLALALAREAETGSTRVDRAVRDTAMCRTARLA